MRWLQSAPHHHRHHILKEFESLTQFYIHSYTIKTYKHTHPQKHTHTNAHTGSETHFFV